MNCPACGAELPGEETCWDRFGTLLAAEAENEELARLHGLTVLTYHLQHPSRTKPWYQEYGAAVMRRVFGDGEDWVDALAGEAGRPGGFDRVRHRWRQVGPQKGWEDAFNERKRAAGAAMPAWVVSEPIPGEATVAVVDPRAPSGQAAQVMAWARSVAEHRCLGGDGWSPTGVAGRAEREHGRGRG